MCFAGVSEISESVVSLVGEDFWGVSLVDMVGSCGWLGGGVKGFLDAREGDALGCGCGCGCR